LLADLPARRRQIVEMIGVESREQRTTMPSLKKTIARSLKAQEASWQPLMATLTMQCAGSPASRPGELLESRCESPVAFTGRVVSFVQTYAGNRVYRLKHSIS
jgi:hypothetical protein